MDVIIRTIPVLLFICNNGFAEPCLDGQYQSKLSLVCTDCTKCISGYGVSTNCSQHKNTLCVKCKEGYASPLEDFTKCRLVHVFVKESGNNVLLRVLVVAVLVIMLVVVLCLCRRWRRSHHQKKDDILLGNAGELAHTAAMTRGFEAGHSSGYSSLSSLPDPVLMLSNIEPPLLVSDVDNHIWVRLGFLLNPEHPGKDWRTVAGLLGYKLNEVSNFALNKSHQFFEELVADYAIRLDATLLNLYKVLQTIRHDVACRVIIEYAVGKQNKTTTTTTV